MFKDLVLKNRSYRGYDESRTFTKEELLEFVDVARLTPSASNVQPLKYYVAWEREDVKKVQSLTKWAAALPDITLPHPGMCPTGFIVICHDTNIGPNVQASAKDVGIVAQTMLLAAVEKDLGGCMIGNFKPDEVKESLKLSDNLVPVLIVAFGKPSEKIVLTDVEADGVTKYYRDANDVHFVPKRKLEDIIIQ